MGDHELLRVGHGSRFSRAWLAVSMAASQDEAQAALFRVTCVERFDDGVRLTSTDSYWTATGWVGDLLDPDDVGSVAAPPEVDELPERVVSVVDHELRIRGLMAFIARRTKKVNPLNPDVPVSFMVTRDRSDVVPTLDPLFDRDRVDVEIPATEVVAGYVSDVEFVDVARFHWEFDPRRAKVLDRIQVSPGLLRKLAAACTAVGSEGCRLAFHGARKPVSWEAVPPAAVTLSGLVMPQRFDDDGGAD